MAGAFIPLACDAGALDDLSTGLVRFGPAGSEADWLVATVWLCTANANYLASSATEVLADGYVARRLTIQHPAQLAASIELELPEIHDRLLAHGHDLELPPAAVLAPPSSLESWPGGDYAASILMRIAPRPSGHHEVACGLLMESSCRTLLIGTDPATQALVFSELPATIERFVRDCTALAPSAYLALASSRSSGDSG